jgi:hypothetical protein
MQKDIGLHAGEAALLDLGPDLPNAVEIGDRRLEEMRMIDPPRRAMRPVDPHPVAHLAAEQRIARHAERLGLGVAQRVLDRAERLGDDAAGGWARRRVELEEDALVIHRILADDFRRQAVDNGGDARRAKALVELAPAGDPVVGRELQEIIVAPARIGAQHLKARDLHRSLPSKVSRRRA